MSNEISSAIFRKALVLYSYSDKHSVYLEHITKVSAIELNPSTVQITIYTYYPGLLIGRAGKQISEIKSLMEKLSGKTTHIYIEEEEMFSLSKINEELN